MMRLHLFTSNFNKQLKNIMMLLILLTLLYGGIHILNYVYQEPDYNARIMWKSFYEQDNINTIFLGSSHVFFDVDVNIVDEYIEGTSFDLSTSNQRIQESYYNLIEANQKYDIKNAFVELYYIPSTGREGDYTATSAMKNSWVNTDYMQTGFARLQGIWNMNDMEHLIEAFMPYVRYRAYLFDWDFIKSKHDIKTSEDYKNFRYHEDFTDNGFFEVNLESRGFWYSTRALKELTTTQSRTPESMCITEDAEKYLLKIIEYCERKDINLVLFVSPIYEVQVISTEGYDVYVDSIRSITEKYQVTFFDFNLIREEYLELNPEDCYDIGHLNSQGAGKFTRVFMDILDGRTESFDKFFYSSFNEKMKEETPHLYGAYWKNTPDGRMMTIAASDTPDMEFKVILNRNDEEGVEYDTPPQSTLQDFDTNRELLVPKDEHGTLTVICKFKEDSNSVESIEITY